MKETVDELESLQRLLHSSRAGATEHLRGIIDERRALTARDLVSLLDGMKVISLATVTAQGEPRISAVDGHFLHASWVWSTSGSSAKARHLESRRAVSVSHVDGEEMALFAHGSAQLLTRGHPRWEETLSHLTAHYGGSPLDWGPDIRLFRLEPSWMVGYAFDRERLLTARQVTPA